MRFLPNGQWTLAKSNEGPEPASIHNLVGKTHTVEVHPQVDHLLRLKNHIQTQPKQSMRIGDVKKSEFGHLADKLPRDAKGNVTPAMIDKHIAGLPKHKVEVKVVPYEMGAQQHRAGVPEYVASVGLHPDTLKSMSPKEQETWSALKGKQHDLGGHEHQVGWARIDPYKTETETTHVPAIHTDMTNAPATTLHTLKHIVPNEGHWHVDEIQSDLGSPKRINEGIKAYTDSASIYSDIVGAARQTALPNEPGRGNHLDNEYATDPKAFAMAYPELAPHLDNFTQSYKDMEAANQEAFATRRGDKTLSDGLDNFRYGMPPRRLLRTPEEMAGLQAKYAAISAKHEANVKPFMDAATELSLKLGKEREANTVPANKMHELLSHGHEDPMHMVHSAINELGRKNGIESMSMDTPNHQAHQSGLRPSNARDDDATGDADNAVWNHIVDGGVNDQQKENLWNAHGGKDLIDRHNHDINFKSAREKLGDEGLKQWAQLALSDNSSWMHGGQHAGEEWDNQMTPGHEESNISGVDEPTMEKLKRMTPPERDALSRFLSDYSGNCNETLKDHLGLNSEDDYYHNPDAAEYDLPVHQINTYDKRPKKLGFQTVDKKSILGEHPTDQYGKVQYAKLAKKLRLLQELLKKV